MSKVKKEAEYQKLLKQFEDGHRKLKGVKQRMAQLRAEINRMPTIVDERLDELLLKSE